MRLVLLFIMCFLPVFVHANSTTTPNAAPLLDIDSGGHKALIRSVVFTPDGRYLVSAGDDKVIRVWDIASGQTVRTLRGQSGEGREGKIFAMALSPNGQWLAVGGRMAKNVIRLYDFKTGEMVAVLPGHENVVNALAFSPDNRYLVSGSGDLTAMIWNVEQWQLLHRLTGHTDAIYAVAFTADSQRVVTGSDDHELRLWSVQGQLLQTLSGHQDKVRAVAVSSQYIASGSDDNTIRLWHSKTGKFIKELANQGTQIGSLSFSPDGQYLVSGVGEGQNNHCHVWSVPKGKKITTYQGHDNSVLATAVSPDGQWVATGGGSNQEIHRWSLRNGQLQQRFIGGGAATWAVGFSADGRHLAWGNTSDYHDSNQRGPLEYQLTLPTPERPLGEPLPIKADHNFIRAHPQFQTQTLRARISGNYGYQAILEVFQDQQVIARIERGSTDGYDHRAYTFTPDGLFIISGGSHGVLTQYDLKGQKLGDYVGHTGDIWAVAVSPDGQLLASGSGDQTVRLWSVATRENLLTLFRSKNGEWVAWTPSGYYTASAQGDNMVGWQINRGVDKAADYVTAAQLRQHFYRPDIVANTVHLRNEQLAITQAQLQPFQLNQAQPPQPPKFQIITPEDEKHTKISQLPMKLSFAANAEPIQAIEIYNNDRLVLTHKIALPELKNSMPQEYTVPLYQTGLNQLRVVAKNRVGETVEQIKVYLDKHNELENIGDLWIIAIGVSQYREQKYSLKYAAADAQALVEQLQQQQGKLYKAVHTTLLADGATLPTAANIRTALKNLTQAQPNDTVILFLAGHGINDNGNYFFLPHDVEAQRLQNTAIPWLELQEALQNTPGKRILLVDTCHSGNAFNPRLVKDTADSRITLISATDEHSVASESSGLNHGVFTDILLRGLRGEADANHDKLVKMLELNSFLFDEMEKLTGGSQTPVLKSPEGLQNFTITMEKLTEGSQIPVLKSPEELQNITQAQLQPFQLSQLNQAQPPKFQIITPEDGKHTKISQLPMKLSFADNAESVKDDDIEIYVNGSKLNVKARKQAIPKIKESHEKEFTVIFSKRDENLVRVVAKNSVGETVRTVKVHFDGNPEENIGNLHLVAIGVNQYYEPENSLKYAAADAQALVKLFKQQHGKSYKTVNAQVLTDQDATAGNIRTALKSFSRVQEEDTVILFLAGHGIRDEKSDYFFLPYDTQRQRLQDTAIRWQELQTALEQVTAGKRILIVDTCYSGRAVNPRLVNDTVHSQIMLISATDANDIISATDPNDNDIAEERDNLKHGVFTHVLLQGLEGKADYGGDNSVSTTELQSYLYNEMRRLTGGSQRPAVIFSEGVLQDFVLTKN